MVVGGWATGRASWSGCGVPVVGEGSLTYAGMGGLEYRVLVRTRKQGEYWFL